MKTIVLTGMMGSGKTTIGKLLAEKLNLPVFDIDTIIEQQENLSIPEIFSSKGESYFRKVERNIIKNTFQNSDMIISLGGGAFENNEIRQFLLKNSTIIYLKTSPEIIFERIKNNTSRPLLCGNMSIEKINKIIETRRENYESASYTITTDNKTPKEVVQEITGVLE